MKKPFKFEEISYHCSCLGPTRYWQTFWCILWCLEDGVRMCADAGWACDSLCFAPTEKARSELPHSWFRADCCGPRSKNLKALLVGQQSTYFIDHKSLKYIFTQSELNMRQRRWLELIKDYNLEVYYHLEKANVVADALSQKSYQVEETPLSFNHARCWLTML